MKVIKIIAVLSFIALSACTVRGPSVSLDVPGVKVIGGGHCPPGQAKKGNC